MLRGIAGFYEKSPKIRKRNFRGTVYVCSDTTILGILCNDHTVGIYSVSAKEKEYPDEKNTISYAYAITREEWNDLKR